jgi:uncharacterized protein YqeY
MTLVEQIKIDSLSARKAKSELKATLLTTLYSEVVNVGKNNGNRDTTDTEAVAVIKKFLKGVDETLNFLGEKVDPRRDVALVEKAILEAYLPKQMSESELKIVIADLIGVLPEKNPKQMGVLMKQLKERYDGQYDGQLASKMIKEQLSQ